MNNQNKKVICHNLNNEKFEVDTDKLIFRPSVYGILIEENNILLSKQWDGYDFPGGGIELDETIAEALKREFIEESGIEIKPIMPIHCETDFFNPDYTDKYKGQYWNAVMMYYLVKKVGGKLTKDNLCDTEKEYADMPEWVCLGDIYEKKFFNSVDSICLIKKAVELKGVLNL